MKYINITITIRHESEYIIYHEKPSPTAKTIEKAL